MFIAIAIREIREAPAEVQHWFAERLTAGETPYEDFESITEPTGDDLSSMAPTDAAPSIQTVLERATDLLLEHGEEALQQVLNQVGVSRVKECPEHRLPDLLNEIETYEPHETFAGGVHA